jgi:hypothetical protein
MIGYLVGAAVMAIGGIAELFLGVPAEQKRLEDIAKPLTAEEAEKEGRSEPGLDEEAQRRRADSERRHSARIGRERAGVRRYRPGPGSASFSPFFGQPAQSKEEWLDGEVDIIARALKEKGELRRDELADEVGARYWGPGRFRTALHEAIAERVVRRTGRDRYAPSG